MKKITFLLIALVAGVCALQLNAQPAEKAPNRTAGRFAELPDGYTQLGETQLYYSIIERTHLEEKIEIVEGDIVRASEIFGKSVFDVVTSNPPYMIGQHGLTNPDSAKAIARHEVKCTFEDVARETAALLKPGGKFYLVHRPFRLAELMVTLVKYKLEPKRMKMVHPFIDKEPNMVLMECVRGGNSRMTVEAPLIVYKEPGIYTEEIYSIYGY